MTMTRLRRLWRDRAGSSAIEFALLVPVLLLMIAGTVEIGQAYRVYSAASRLASHYAMVWADCTDTPAGACSTEMSNLAAAATISNIAPQLVVSNLSLQMFQVQLTATGSTTTYASPSGAAPSAAQIAAARTKFGASSVVIVSATYSHSLMFFSDTMSGFFAGALAPTYTVAMLRS